MRILLINWARIADGAHVGGGVNGYCQGLAIQLAQRGHRVAYLSSGVRYTQPLDATTSPSIERMPDYVFPGTPAIGVVEVVNSPVVAPGIFQFNRPDRELASSSLETLLAGFLAEHRFDVVHFHNIEGLSAACMDIARGAPSRPRVLFSLHNYHTVCPQVYLMQAIENSSMRAPCRDYRNGHACVACERTHDPEVEVARRLGVPEPSTPPITHGVRAPQAVPVDLTLDNRIVPEPASDLAPNGYAMRRAEMVAALSRCHAVLAVSSFVRRKFEAFGVEPRVMRELPIGTRMIELAREHRARSGAASGAARARAAETSGRSIGLAFLGYHNLYKGLHVLVAALEAMDADTLSRFSLHVHAKDVAPIEPRLEKLRHRLAELVVKPGYAHEQVPALLEDRDLLVVPSVWWDNGPQTVMEAVACGVPVLASEIGGIPDLVTDNVNALLVRAGDPAALAARLREVAKDPTIITRLRENLASNPPRLNSMEAHAIEMETLYADLFAEAGALQDAVA